MDAHEGALNPLQILHKHAPSTALLSASQGLPLGEARMRNESAYGGVYDDMKKKSRSAVCTCLSASQEGAPSRSCPFHKLRCKCGRPSQRRHVCTPRPEDGAVPYTKCDACEDEFCPMHQHRHCRMWTRDMTKCRCHLCGLQYRTAWASHAATNGTLSNTTFQWRNGTRHRRTLGAAETAAEGAASPASGSPVQFLTQTFDQATINALPPALSWKAQLGANSPIYNQGDCAGCYAFATTTSASDRGFLVGYAPWRGVLLSPMCQLACGSDGLTLAGSGIVMKSSGCNEGFIEDGFYTLQQSGTASTSQVPVNVTSSEPYVASCSSLACPPEGTSYKVPSYVRADLYDAYGVPLGKYTPLTGTQLATNMLNIMAAVANQGPVATCLRVYADFYTFWSSAADTTNVYDYNWSKGGTSSDADQGAVAFGSETESAEFHAVVITGWGTVTNASGDQVPFWEVRNSWGTTNAGKDGYFLIRRGVNCCGIETDVVGAYFPTANSMTPGVTAGQVTSSLTEKPTYMVPTALTLPPPVTSGVPLGVDDDDAQSGASGGMTFGKALRWALIAVTVVVLLLVAAWVVKTFFLGAAAAPPRPRDPLGAFGALNAGESTTLPPIPSFPPTLGSSQSSGRPSTSLDAFAEFV